MTKCQTPDRGDKPLGSSSRQDRGGSVRGVTAKPVLPWHDGRRGREPEAPTLGVGRRVKGSGVPGAVERAILRQVPVVVNR